jgi:molybdopterin-guanine dinucleotide biosynthesis protein MobB
MTAAVLAVVGHSGAGKTSLLERLLPALASRGVRVGAVKHASHGFLADRPGKDSHRLYESGARAVALVSCEQVASFTRLDVACAGEPSLAVALGTLPAELDLVLVEGFSWEPIPRIVVVGPGERPAPEHVARGELLAVVEGAPCPERRRAEFPAALVEALARAIQDRVEAAPPVRRAREPSAAARGPVFP